MQYTFFIIFGLLLFCSCRSNSKNTVNTATKNLPNNEIVKEENTKANDNNTAALDSNVVVSFFSKGAGIDLAAKEKTDAFIIKFNKDNQQNILAEQYRWGREGEIDYCINLLSLKVALRLQFKTELNDLLAKNNVNISFGQLCTRRR